MAAPTTVHQAIGGFIYKLLLDHVLSHGGPCMPFMSPIDVQLDEDDRTVVQPDVLIVKVVVYDLENCDIPAIYNFEDTVPVGIWGGECSIDFKTIYSHISFLYD